MRNRQRDSEFETVFVGEKALVGDDVSGLVIEVSARFREISARPVESDVAHHWGSCDILTEDGETIGQVTNVGFAQNGGVTVSELIEVRPNVRATRGRIIYQQYPTTTK